MINLVQKYLKYPETEIDYNTEQNSRNYSSIFYILQISFFKLGTIYH